MGRKRSRVTEDTKASEPPAPASAPPLAAGAGDASGGSILSRLYAEIEIADAEVANRLSLTSAVALSRHWIARKEKELGWIRISKIFTSIGYSHADHKNVRNAYDSEDSNLVRKFAASEEGRLFVEALETLVARRTQAPLSIENQTPATNGIPEKTAIQPAREKSATASQKKEQVANARAVKAPRATRSATPLPSSGDPVSVSPARTPAPTLAPASTPAPAPTLVPAPTIASAPTPASTEVERKAVTYDRLE